MGLNKKILVHICCAPCGTASIKRLKLDGYEVVAYFSNSNIWPFEEYKKRLKGVRFLAGEMEFVVEEDHYEHSSWLDWIKGLEEEPEKGERCKKCFEFALLRTSRMADRLGIPAFTTTLTISPHKISRQIFEIGSRFPKYLPIDFKKRDGFLESLKMSKEFGLYRQNYCGCEFSMRD